VALIPARAGSKRVPGKNVRRLGAHPVLAYTIAAARASGVFDAIVVSTDSDQYADIARHYGAEVPFLRPAEMAAELSPDIEWLEYTLARLQSEGRDFAAFSLLRPTSPFRQGTTIATAWEQFRSAAGVDSLRAVEKCQQHPGKMWVVRGERMTPLLPLGPATQPWHSTAYQALPEIHVQNASLEIAWSRVVSQTRTISGHVLMPFFMPEHEGFDINNSIDWEAAVHLLERGAVTLPVVDQEPYPHDIK
jgi:N-acylneuraminate cytidylyltransferase